MKKSRFTDSQIIAVLKQAEAAPGFMNYAMNMLDDFNREGWGSKSICRYLRRG